MGKGVPDLQVGQHFMLQTHAISSTYNYSPAQQEKKNITEMW